MRAVLLLVVGLVAGCGGGALPAVGGGSSTSSSSSSGAPVDPLWEVTTWCRETANNDRGLNVYINDTRSTHRAPVEVDVESIIDGYEPSRRTDRFNPVQTDRTIYWTRGMPDTWQVIDISVVTVLSLGAQSETRTIRIARHTGEVLGPDCP